MIGKVIAGAAMLALAVPDAQARAAPAGKASRTTAARRAPAHADWVGTVVATPEGGMRMGNPDAKVKLIEYGSRTCPHCARFDAEGVPALKAGPIARGQLSYEFRDFPIHGALDLGPILLGRCVPARAFFPLLDAMMARQASLSGRADTVPAEQQQRLQAAAPAAVAGYLAKFYGYTDFVVRRGLPAAKAAACLADAKAIDAIAERAAAANRTYGVASTPTFIVDGTVAAGVSDWTALAPVVAAAVAR